MTNIVEQPDRDKVYKRKVSWARIVSDVISPPVVWAVLVIPVAIHYSETTIGAIFWASLYAIFICLLPISYVAYNVWKGNISDLHMKNRKERMRPLLVTILCTAIVWFLLKVLGAPRVFPILALLSLIQITVIAIITLGWQISMHTMSIAGAVVAIGMIFSVEAGLWLSPLVPLVAAARLTLKRHTPAQVIAGTILGALLPAMFLGLLPQGMLQML